MEAATSDSLETAPKGSGARSIYKVVVKGEFNTIPLSTHSTEDFLLVRRI